MKKDVAIYIAGSDGFVGKRLLSILAERGYSNLLNLGTSQPNILDSYELAESFGDTQPEYVFFLGGNSGGIQANLEKPADLMQNNLQSVSNVINASHIHGVKRLLYLASSCVYPRDVDQPLKPAMLMTGRLEPTNASYATAKLAGIELCKAYRSQYKDCFITAIPCNVYGPGDDFSENESHVIGALIRKVYQASEWDDPFVEVWGSGAPEREFIYVDDLVDACIFTMEKYYGDDPLNIGTGLAISIAELASLVKNIVGYKGRLQFNPKKPDGMPKKFLDTSPLFELGWRPQVDLENGIRLTYEWYCKQGTHAGR